MNLEDKLISYIRMKGKAKFQEIVNYFSNHSESELRQITYELITNGKLKLENGYCIINK